MNLLPLIEERQGISAPEMAKHFGVTEQTVHEYLKPLVESGQVQRKINRFKERRTSYYVDSKPAWPATERTLHSVREIKSLFEYA